MRQVRGMAAKAVRRPARAARHHPIRSVAVIVMSLTLFVVVGSVGWVRGSTQDSVYDVAEVPPAPVAIVFGAGLRPDGTPSVWLQARLAAARDLYRTGKVQAILVSGDHGRNEHDEVGAMTTWLVANGVPAAKVVADHAGFDTYDSCQRARRIFGIDHAIAVTQGFHVRRAVFLCRQAGIATVGVASAAVGGRPALNAVRELPASVKAAFDAVVNPGPRYLGREEPGVKAALAD